MRVRRARALVVVFRGERPVVYNFLTQQALACDARALDILGGAGEWRPLDELFDGLRAFEPQSVARALYALIEQGALLVEGSAAAERDAAYERGWEWGETAGLYHFGLKNTRFVAPSALAEWFAARREQVPRPPLYTTNDGRPSTPLPDPEARRQPFATMRRRRSTRRFGPGPLALRDLADCLFAGFGITGFLEDPLTGTLPLSMTPSGGARNPYEAYVYARRVAGLEPGMYHYAAIDHTLGALPAAVLPPISVLLSGQTWADPAAALLLLVARFERTMWKYAHPSAYRVALIEAGHIAQNVLLAATARGLAAAPTAALDDRAVDCTLGLTDLTEAAIYAVVIGPGAEPRSTP
ncbi:MAG TPA: SagB family peptide dehydrogenase [Roseiflexaceae bacterium]|nr:SagB family peptide dehydrogenase [Roseiflexaceae bacterium]